MSRSLYRCYLYFVALLMLFYLSIGLSLILDTLLQQTPLRGSAANPPTRVDAVQSLIFVVIAALVGGGIGGLHYWLILRDRRSHPQAGESAARSFFLNGAEAIAALVFIAAVIGIVSHYGSGSTPDYNLATPIEIAITSLAVAAILEWERRQALPTGGAALAFQRLHEYGVPFVLLLFAVTPTWRRAISEAASSVVEQDTSSQPCDLSGSCAPTHQPVFLWLAALLAVLSLLWFAWLARRDAHSRIRQFLHLASFAYGVIWLAVGLRSGVEQALRDGLSLSVSRSSVADVLTSLLFGALVALAFGLWLRREAADLPMGAGAVLLSEEAIADLIFAVPGWFGLGLALDTLVESHVPNGATVTHSDIAVALSLLSLGVVYLLVERDLIRRTHALQIAGPRRAMTLALLAAGTLTTAAGAAATLYILATNLLLPPSANWQGAARSSATALVVGASLAGLYVWRGRREGAFSHLRAHPSTAPTPEEAAAKPPDQIGAVLDDFAAGKLSRDEAASRLRELVHANR